jgi:hypothetical protein
VVAQSDGFLGFASIGKLGARYAGRFVEIILLAILLYYVYRLSKVEIREEEADVSKEHAA